MKPPRRSRIHCPFFSLQIVAVTSPLCCRALTRNPPGVRNVSNRAFNVCGQYANKFNFPSKQESNISLIAPIIPSVSVHAPVRPYRDGAIAVIDNSRKAVYGYDQRAEVFGSKGMVATGNDSASQAVISNENGVTGEVPLHFFLERYMAAYAKEVKCFIDAIVNKKKAEQ